MSTSSTSSTGIPWVKTASKARSSLAPLSALGEWAWHALRLYCGDVGNDGRLRKRDVHVALNRKVTASKAGQLIAELVEYDLLLDKGEHWQFPGWLDEQPSSAQWNDPVERERWARARALRKDPELRERVKARDANLCRYCSVRVNWKDRTSAIGGTYDHVDPDGPNSYDNVVVACRKCNGNKRARTPEQADMPLLPPPLPTSMRAVPSQPGASSRGQPGASSGPRNPSRAPARPTRAGSELAPSAQAGAS